MRAQRIRSRQRHREGSAPIPRHPYRDSAVFHLVLGGVVLLLAWLTGGELTRAALVALAYVVLAVGWSWYRFRQRLERRGRGEAANEAGRT